MALYESLLFAIKCNQPRRHYIKEVKKSGIFENGFKDALPQTAVAKAVRKHFADENGKRKKAIIIGFDGARADSLLGIIKDRRPTESTRYSAISDFRDNGHLYLAYTGGVEGDKVTMQETSTTPGWATVLTGKWATEHKLATNCLAPLNRDTPTIIIEYARKGLHCSFAAEWDVHFENTYIDEMEIAKEEKLPVTYKHPRTDEELHRDMLASIDNDDDLIFGIYEEPDINGHESVFSNCSHRYVRSVEDCDRNAYALIEHIKSRPTYGDEDWLIIMTSDHGGHALRHGTQKIQDRMIYIASNVDIDG